VVGDTELFGTTDNQFWDPQNLRWSLAEKFQVGHHVLSDRAKTVNVVSVAVSAAAPTALFDLDVDGLDSFYVSGQVGAVAAGQSESKGINYGVWRETGITADVLRQAGISRSQAVTAHRRVYKQLATVESESDRRCSNRFA
jgi:hypothetical protein